MIPLDFETKYSKGLTYKELSEYYNVSLDRVRWWIRQNELRRNIEYKRLSEHEKPTGVQLYEEYIMRGRTRKQIAEKYNVSTTSVSKWLKKYGIKKL